MKNKQWKIKVRGVKEPIFVSEIISFCEQNSGISLFGLRKEVLNDESNAEPLLSCLCCNGSLVVSRSSKSIYVKHKPKNDRDEDDAVLSCPFYQGKSSPIFENKPNNESKLSKFLKKHMANIVKFDSRTVKKSVKIDRVVIDEENQKEWRSPDIYFETKDGRKWAIEVIKSWLNPEVIQHRDHFYRKNNIHILWLSFEDNMSESSITFGDLMFGLDNKRNVLSFSISTIKESYRNKKFFLNVLYPIEVDGLVKIEKSQVRFQDLSISADLEIYYVDGSNIEYSDIRSFLITSHQIDFFISDDENAMLQSQIISKKTLHRIESNSHKFYFNKNSALLNLTELDKLPKYFIANENARVSKVHDALNLNIIILDKINSGDEVSARNVRRILKLENAQEVLSLLSSKGIFSKSIMLNEEERNNAYAKKILFLLDDNQKNIDDFILSSKVISDISCSKDVTDMKVAKKLIVLHKISFLKPYKKAISLNRQKQDLINNFNIIDYLRLFAFINVVSFDSNLIHKECILNLDPDKANQLQDILITRSPASNYSKTMHDNILLLLQDL